LSRYLVKIDIAPEMRSDSDVIDLYEQVSLSNYLEILLKNKTPF
jgi:hypothetical protein